MTSRYLQFVVLIVLLIVAGGELVTAQKRIKDKHIINQQERMVFKQWDRNKFTPTSGFLGLNPEYWLTWAWHPNYPKTDLRPLGPYGPQTQRLGLVAAMQSTDQEYKLQADTFKNTALSEGINYSSLSSPIDPLWLLYYKREFEPLLNFSPLGAISGLEAAQIAYLTRTGAYKWYQDESQILSERLRGMMGNTIDRGARITGYHLLLQDYRKLSADWESRKQNAAKFLLYKSGVEKLRVRGLSISDPREYASDIEIADRILSRSKL